MIAGHQRLKEHSRFLFIPGPDDIGDLSNYFQIFKCLPYLSCLNDVYICFSGPSNVLPRCSLPKYITEELQNHIPNAVFLSNPCRFLFFLLFPQNYMLKIIFEEEFLYHLTVLEFLFVLIFTSDIVSCDCIDSPLVFVDLYLIVCPVS